MIIIEDTGVGIPEDKIDDVFDLFYSTKKAGEGTGLGMWMSYELVKKYKGEIFISSQVGSGTKVTIIIPGGVMNESILVVEDEKIVRVSLVDALKTEGSYRTICRRWQ